MARYLSVIALLAGLAAAVREETHQEAFLEEGLDQEMKLVPAKISKAIRRAGRHAQEAMQAAEEKKANMTQAKASATQKASEASELQAASSKAMEEAAVKRDEAQKKKTEAEQAVREEGKADQALTAALQDVTDKEADLTSKEAQYREFMKEVNKKIQDLVNDKIKANEALDKLREDLETKKDKAEALTAEKAAKGAISEKATEHKEAAEAEMQEAVDKANKAQEVAEKAQNDFIIAKAEADQAEQMHSQAVKELEKKTDLHQMVENVRNKTDDFYKAWRPHFVSRRTVARTVRSRHMSSSARTPTSKQAWRGTTRWSSPSAACTPLTRNSTISWPAASKRFMRTRMLHMLSSVIRRRSSKWKARKSTSRSVAEACGRT
mmetsp:Transcript_128942/g.181884  ORF Transcript_128942/g.181884 Transcript_128942/m.181884 type:complete len:379 (+) Transcript_128942:78-1214(+)